MVEFEWNPDKEQSNVRKHGVEFTEAATVFGDPLELTIADPDHSVGEFRLSEMLIRQTLHSGGVLIGYVAILRA